MASVGPGNYVVVALHVGGAKASDMKSGVTTRTSFRYLMVSCRYRFAQRKTCRRGRSHRELLEEIGLTLTVENLTLLTDVAFRVPLPDVKLQHVYVYSTSVHIPYLNANRRTLAKVKHVVIAQSTVHRDDSYVVLTTIDIDG
jgi:hypothetical protein